MNPIEELYRRNRTRSIHNNIFRQDNDLLFHKNTRLFPCGILLPRHTNLTSISSLLTNSIDSSISPPREIYSAIEFEDTSPLPLLRTFLLTFCPLSGVREEGRSNVGATITVEVPSGGRPLDSS
ncbi:hypothetical protein V6N11_065428 [Hibiscus sabdariffa]|uniref:Uncharacterized protein n=2 Tax=Hibiscus sabdariffa TaxID=183260 RepID=A0ABR2AB01_9ROSI